MNVMLILQLSRVARLAGHVLLWLKSPLFVPMTVIPEMARTAFPGFVRVMTCGALAVPRQVGLKQ